MPYQLLYSETTRKQIKKLHPKIKAVVKKNRKASGKSLFGQTARKGTIRLFIAAGKTIPDYL
jgi:mRNA-degrading endonuclease RelE of RelBE toxin-antitoxin system